MTSAGNGTGNSGHMWCDTNHAAEGYPRKILKQRTCPHPIWGERTWKVTASHAAARALGPWGAVVLPVEQLMRVPVHLQRLLAIEVGRQAGRDLTSEAMQPREAV
jgi:hypothetical protein